MTPCRECDFWGPEEVSIVRDRERGPERFKRCMCPAIGPGPQYASLEMRPHLQVFVSGSTRNQLLTHATFGCTEGVKGRRA